MSFAENDKIDIIKVNEESYYPRVGLSYVHRMNSYSVNCIKKILEPLPLMKLDKTTEVTSFSNCFNRCNLLQSIPHNLFSYNPKATDFIYCFCNCSSLQQIPENLFANHPNATSFSGCFEGCTSLKAIPEKLFSKNPNVDTFVQCFSGCTSLQSIPENIFANNFKVTTFHYCLHNCTRLKVFTIKIASSKVTGCPNFTSIYSDSNVIIKVPSGSTTQTTFTNWKGSTTNVTIMPY